MRWRQVALAAALALATGAIFYQRANLTVAVATSLLVYVGIRVLIATYYRTKYWYHRDDTRHSRQCRRCGRRVSRRAGDTLIRCYHRINQHPHGAKPEQQCDWVEGWPVTRLFTRSLFARQFRRSITWKRLGVIALACALLFTPVSISAGGALSSSGGAAATTNGTATPTPTETEAPTATATPDPSKAQQGYDLSVVEGEFIEMLNTERESRGLQPVTRRDELTTMGRSHSADMAEHDYMGHEEPNGSTIQDRYQDRGLLPECHLPISGTERYYAGAENVAHYWVDESVRTENGVTYVDSERDLARGLFRGWMNSRPHREAMLVASADEAGLGLYIDSRGKVYASLELC